ncbi:hypothetical protein [Streptomyces sp. NPDC059533]
MPRAKRRLPSREKAGHLGGVHPALAVLAGLTAAGGAVPVLRGLIR